MINISLSCLSLPSFSPFSANLCIDQFFIYCRWVFSTQQGPWLHVLIFLGKKFSILVWFWKVLIKYSDGLCLGHTPIPWTNNSGYRGGIYYDLMLLSQHPPSNQDFGYITRNNAGIWGCSPGLEILSNIQPF